MATSISAATLRVTIKEEITLDGEDRGGTTVLEVASITKVVGFIASVPTSTNGLELLQMGSSAGVGKIVGSTLKYMRVTNRDASNYITLHIQTASSDFTQVKIEAGKSHILNNNQLANDSDIDSTSFADITSVQALANTAAVDVEVWAAHTG